MNGPKIYFEIGPVIITQTTVSSFVVMLMLCIGGYFLGRNLKKRPGRMQVITEKLVTMLYNLVEDTMGKHNSYWAPYIGALMMSSLFGSLIGMTGIFRSSTSDLATTGTWAIMTSVLVWACNIRVNGFGGWLKGFTEPVAVMTPMNIISEIAQPISMAFRHFGNIMGGSVLTSLVYSALAAASALIIGLISSSSIAVAIILIILGAALIAAGFKKSKFILKLFGIVSAVLGIFSILEMFGILTGVPILSVGIPGVMSLYFDVFAGGVQALVFSLLTMVYVGSACPPPEEVAEIKAAKKH